MSRAAMNDGLFRHENSNLDRHDAPHPLPNEARLRFALGRVSEAEYGNGRRNPRPCDRFRRQR